MSLHPTRPIWNHYETQTVNDQKIIPQDLPKRSPCKQAKLQDGTNARRRPPIDGADYWADWTPGPTGYGSFD